jgi:hypothetical protein
MSVTAYISKIWNDAFSRALAIIIVSFLGFLGMMFLKIIPKIFIDNILRYWKYIVLVVSIILNIIQFVLYQKMVSRNKNLIFESKAYWLQKKDGTKDGPFCSNCWDTKKLMVRLHVSDSHHECPNCKFEFNYPEMSGVGAYVG